MNQPGLHEGGQYAFAPVTSRNAQEHVAQNPAAHESHLVRPGNAGQANAAQAAYEAAQRAYMQALREHGVPQQVQGLQQAAAGMEEFAQLAGVADPWRPSPPQPAPQGIIIPPGSSTPRKEDGDDDRRPVSALW